MNRIKDKSQDTFFIIAIEENGNRTKKSISFKYGTVEGHRSELTKYTHKIKDKTGNIKGKKKII